MSTLTAPTAAPPVDRTVRRAGRRRARRWKVTPLLVATVLVALAGATVIAYLPAAKWVSRLNQAAVVDRYKSDVDHADPTAAAQLRSAQRYNDALSAGALIAANTNVPTGAGSTSDDSLDYWKQLRTDSGMMARIQIPSIDVDLPIYHGTSQATLLKGAGHLQGTSLPIGGKGTHSVITAHRGLAQATMFTNLDKLDAGDRFTITTFGRVLTYEVVTTKVVDPEDTATLKQQTGKDLVTLVTCTPLGVNSHRMLVTGRRVAPTPERNLAAARSGTAPAPFPWFVPGYLAALVLIALYARWAGKIPAAAGTPAATAARGPGRLRAAALARAARRGAAAAPAAGLAGPPPPSSGPSPEAPAADTDALSGLLDRAGLIEALAGSVHGTERNGIAVLFVRLDRLDLINGRLGRMAGDSALRTVASRLAASVGPGGLAARVSSSTFAVVRGETEGAAAWADGAVAAATAPLDAAGQALTPACAAVLVTTDGFHHDSETLVADAEAAARRRFPAGRGRVEHARIGLATDPFGAEIAAQVHQAVADGAITADYQPVIDLETAEVVGVEALARWRGAPAGYEAPEDFLDVAAAVGLLPEILDRILEQACRDFASGAAAERGWWVSVNLATDDCTDPTLPGRIARILDETGLDAHRLVLEVSERAIPDPAAERALRHLADVGVTLAIDDFGSGWSSLAQLRSLPISLIKLDQSLIADRSGQDAHVVVAVIGLAQALGLDTLAEGVETAEDLLVLRLSQCTFGQGFWWSGAASLATVLERFPAPVRAVTAPAEPEPGEPAPALPDALADGPGQGIDASWLDLSTEDFLARLRAMRPTAGAPTTKEIDQP